MSINFESVIVHVQYVYYGLYMYIHIYYFTLLISSGDVQEES